jgi:hypothetical protein
LKRQQESYFFIFEISPMGDQESMQMHVNVFSFTYKKKKITKKEEKNTFLPSF